MAKNKYPKTKAGKIALTQIMMNGVTVDAAEFPDPPTKSAGLEVLLKEATSDRNFRIIADANAREKREIETDSFDDLNNALKGNIKWRAGYERR